MPTSSPRQPASTQAASSPDYPGVQVIIPALNEEAALPLVLRDLPRVDRVIVAGPEFKCAPAKVVGYCSRKTAYGNPKCRRAAGTLSRYLGDFIRRYLAVL